MLQRGNTVEQLYFFVGFLHGVVGHESNQLFELIDVSDHFEFLFLVDENKRLLLSRQQFNDVAERAGALCIPDASSRSQPLRP